MKLEGADQIEDPPPPTPPTPPRSFSHTVTNFSAMLTVVLQCGPGDAQEVHRRWLGKATRSPFSLFSVKALPGPQR